MKVLKKIEAELISQGFTFNSKDLDRPWGAFWAIKQECSREFLINFFPEYVSLLDENVPISPKILAVAPQRRLSWQYHNRRSELWKVIDGEVGVVKSDSDIQNPMVSYKREEVICLNQGERHRLIGLQNWGVVAEIWVHTNVNNPSNEDDIIRLEDDFGR
ncbi:cupin domain-containing protein [Ekhidna sp.]